MSSEHGVDVTDVASSQWTWRRRNGRGVVIIGMVSPG